MSKKRPDGSIKIVTNTGWQKVNQTVDTIISFFLTICLLSAELYCCLKRMKLSKKVAQFKTINSSGSRRSTQSSTLLSLSSYL